MVGAVAGPSNDFGWSPPQVIARAKLCVSVGLLGVIKCTWLAHSFHVVSNKLSLRYVLAFLYCSNRIELPPITTWEYVKNVALFGVIVFVIAEYMLGVRKVVCPVIGVLVYS